VSLARDEIAEQPEVLARLLRVEAGAIAAAAQAVRDRRPRYAVLAARGSSDNAARYAQHLLGRLCGLPVALATPSLHTLYDAPPRYRDALVVGISQSGASPDVVGVVEAATREGSVSIAITNDAGSPMAAAAEHVIELGAGDERSVAATKTYTASLGAVAALAAAVAGDRERARELDAVPAVLARQLTLTEGPEAAAAAATGWARLAAIGRGANYATAFEAALKIKELTGVAAEPYSPADFLHGPIAVVDEGFPVLAIAASGPALEGVREVLARVRERGGTTWAIADDADAVAGETGRLALVPTPEWLSPLVAVVPAQLLAVAAAERRGLDVDRPFGLEKVTRTT
jgi:glucosamine--fructose-6-phosphate aminotransferase (isomerizing)